jgi:hypothetical protein
VNQSHPILTEEKNLIEQLIFAAFKKLNLPQEKYELFLNSASNNQLTVTQYICNDKNFCSSPDFLNTIQEIYPKVSQNLHLFKEEERKWLETIKESIDNLVTALTKLPIEGEKLSEELIKKTQNTFNQIQQSTQTFSSGFKAVINSLCKKLSLNPIFRATEIKHNIVNQFKPELNKIKDSKPKESLGDTLDSAGQNHIFPKTPS